MTLLPRPGISHFLAYRCRCKLQQRVLLVHVCFHHRLVRTTQLALLVFAVHKWIDGTLPPGDGGLALAYHLPGLFIFRGCCQR